MSLQNLSSKEGKKSRKRVGRGNGSGHGTFSCRGMKGQSARSGGRRRPGFEGGQTPYIQKMPKLKGFKNPNRVEFQVVNLSDLNIFEANEQVNPETLYAKKLICKRHIPVKLLAKGELTKALEVTVHKASEKAKEAVVSQKGKLNVLFTPSAE